MLNEDILKRKYKKFISIRQEGVYKVIGSAGCSDYGEGSGFLDWLKERAISLSDNKYQYLLQTDNCLTEILFIQKINSTNNLKDGNKFSYHEIVDVFWQPSDKSPKTLTNRLENFGFNRFIPNIGKV